MTAGTSAVSAECDERIATPDERIGALEAKWDALFRFMDAVAVRTGTPRPGEFLEPPQVGTP